MAAKANLDLVEQLLTRIIDKFTESIATMMREFTKTINDTFSVRISSLETKLLSIESKLSQPNPQIIPDPNVTTPTIATIVSNAIQELESHKAEAHVKSFNVIITGLSPISGTPDTVLVEKFCEDNLTVKPHVTRTRRIGRAAGANSAQKLCVTLDSPAAAINLIEASSILRQNSSLSHIYINRDLTRVQSEAAYKARMAKRAGSSANTATPPQPPPTHALLGQPFSANS